MSRPIPPKRKNELQEIIRDFSCKSDGSFLIVTKHAKERMRKRDIDLADVTSVLSNGKIKKEHPPLGPEAPDWRWEMLHKGITLIYKMDPDPPMKIILITCWKGKMPTGEII